MDEEKELLRQQLEQMSMNLAERHATLVEREAALTTERTLVMAAEAEVQEVTGRSSAYPIQQASTGQPMPEQGYRNQILPLLLSQSSTRVPKFDGHGQLHLW